MSRSTWIAVVALGLALGFATYQSTRKKTPVLAIEKNISPSESSSDPFDREIAKDFVAARILAGMKINQPQEQVPDSYVLLQLKCDTVYFLQRLAARTNTKPSSFEQEKIIKGLYQNIWNHCHQTKTLPSDLGAVEIQKAAFNYLDTIAPKDASAVKIEEENQIRDGQAKLNAQRSRHAITDWNEFEAKH